MTPTEFVEAIRAMHEPYLPTVVLVTGEDGEWREPTRTEQAESMALWCDGCRTTADKCLVAHLFVLVETGAAVIDAAHLARLREWSARTFGPTARTKGVIEHIRKELIEVEADPFDVKEWIDVVILALDGAWRHGAEPQQIIDTIIAKQARNEGRTWPDWRTASEDQAIEHDRSRDV